MTCDMSHVVGVTSSLALMVCDLWYIEDLEEKDDRLNEWMNDGGDCKTAPATPGLLIIYSLSWGKQYKLNSWLKKFLKMPDQSLKV